MATIMYGTRRNICFATSATTSVTMPVAVIHGSSAGMPRTKACIDSKKRAPDGMGTPKKCRSCAAMMRRPAPEVKPTITVCEMKLTRAPRRATPIASCSGPR